MNITRESGNNNQWYSWIGKREDPSFFKLRWEKTTVFTSVTSGFTNEDKSYREKDYP